MQQTGSPRTRRPTRNETADKSAGLGLFPTGPASVLAGTSLPCLPLFLIAAVVGGCAFGALVIGSLSAANRLAPPEARAQVISVYFVFAYAGLGPGRTELPRGRVRAAAR